MSNKIEIVLPKMGESVDEATITGWLKNEGDDIKEDDLIVEIATDKVDSEVPSEVSGVLIQKLCKINDVVKVGDPIAIIETDKKIESLTIENNQKSSSDITETTSYKSETIVTEPIEYFKKADSIIEKNDNKLSERIYSPLVKNISKKEGISLKDHFSYFCYFLFLALYYQSKNILTEINCHNSVRKYWMKVNFHIAKKS